MSVFLQLTLSQMRENKGQLVEMAGDGFVIGKYTRELHEPRSINLQYPPAVSDPYMYRKP